MPIREIDGHYIADIRVGGKRIRKTLNTNDRREAEYHYAKLTSGGLLDALYPVPSSAIYRDTDIMELCRKTRERAAVRGIEFALTSSDVVALFMEADNRCQVTGLPFDRVYRPTGASKRPFAASIDRIDNRVGYIVGNVRIVCVMVNVALGEWGYEALKRIAVSVAIRENMI